MISINKTLDNKSNTGIDLAKFVCSILVFFVHFHLLDINKGLYFYYANYYLTNCLGRIAVPFFFISSGYFLFKKIKNNLSSKKRIIKNYIFKMLKLYIIWMCISFNYGTIHLWYLLVSAITILLIIALQKYISNRTITIVFLAFFTIGCFLDTYYNLTQSFIDLSKSSFIISIIDFVFIYLRNGVFSGPLFMFIGYLLANDKITFKKNNIVYLFVSFGLYFCEVFIVEHFSLARDYNMYFMQVPTVFFMFNVLLNYNPIKIETGITLRNVSTLVYLSQFVNAYIANRLLEISGLVNSVGYTTKTLWYLLFTIIISFLIYKISNIKYCSFLKNIFS